MMFEEPSYQAVARSFDAAAGAAAYGLLKELTKPLATGINNMPRSNFGNPTDLFSWLKNSTGVDGDDMAEFLDNLARPSEPGNEPGPLGTKSQAEMKQLSHFMDSWASFCGKAMEKRMTEFHDLEISSTTPVFDHLLLPKDIHEEVIESSSPMRLGNSDSELPEEWSRNLHHSLKSVRALYLLSLSIPEIDLKAVM